MPLRIAEVAVDVAVLAAEVVEHGNPNLRGDAAAARSWRSRRDDRRRPRSDQPRGDEGDERVARGGQSSRGGTEATRGRGPPRVLPEARLPFPPRVGFNAVTEMTGETSTDAELVARCRSGEVLAWAELVERFSRYVYAISTQAFRLSPADAEDVFQEVFARTYEHLDRLRDDRRSGPGSGS